MAVTFSKRHEVVHLINNYYRLRFFQLALGLELNSDFLKTRSEMQLVGSSLPPNQKIFMLAKVERKAFFGTMRLFPKVF